MKTIFENCKLILTGCITLFFFNMFATISSASAQAVLFDFDNAPLHSPLPINQTVSGITAHLSATAQGYSIQEANVLGFVPQGFAGRIIYPNSIYLADLLIGFDKTLTDFSIMYACQELGCDDAATMRVTAFMNGTFTGTNTKTASNPGTWPVDTLRCSFPQGFNSVVVHYDHRPPTCQDYGVIFVADNMRVTAINTNGILNQKILIQGFYNSATDLMVQDTVAVYLRNSSSPYAVTDSSKAFLSSSGAGTFLFNNIANSTPYYIQVKHRSSIETWSAAAVSFVSNNLIYDFTISASQAFGNNMALLNALPTRFGVYSGDVNQDGIIDLTDVILVFNDARSFVAGYILTDLNGDNLADLTDLILAFNNSSNFVRKIIP